MAIIRYYLFSLILVSATTAFTQSSGISFSISDSNTGLGMRFQYVHKIKEKINFGGGLRIHLNPNIRYKDSAMFDHTFYAKNFNQHVGLSAFFEYKLSINNWKLDPFIGYHSQVLRTARQVVIFPNTDPVQFEWEEPLTAWNNMLVLGLNYDISDQFSLNVNSGIGLSSLYNVDKRVLLPDISPSSNNTSQVNVSFGIGIVTWLSSN